MDDSKVKRKAGRPSKLTKKTHARIVELVKAGNFLSTAAMCAGVRAEVAKDWIRDGVLFAQKVEAGTLRVWEMTAHEVARMKFSEEVQAAMGEATARDVLLIEKAAVKDWKAAAWVLERRERTLFSPRVEVTGADGGPVVVRTWADIAKKASDELEPKDEPKGNE